MIFLLKNSEYLQSYLYIILPSYSIVSEFIYTVHLTSKEDTQHHKSIFARIIESQMKKSTHEFKSSPYNKTNYQFIIVHVTTKRVQDYAQLLDWEWFSLIGNVITRYLIR